MRALLRIVSGILLTCGAGLAAILFVGSSSLDWYQGLAKPTLAPVAWIFLPLWLILYLLMSVAVAFVWTTEPASHEREGWVRFYFIQVLFNAAWIVFFFGLHAMLIAFIDMLFLAFIVSSLIAGAWDINKRATYLLAPYLISTLSFAFINLNIWFLN